MSQNTALVPLRVPQPTGMPVLPPELEREIFEMSARIHPGNAVRLVLVARRVQIWIEKIIYEIVTLSNPTVCNRFLRTVDTRPASFFAAQVKSLCIPIDITHSTARRILSVCQGVINLAFWLMDGPPLFHLISSLRPRRLSVNIRGLFGSDEQPDFSHPFFSDVTHLEFVDRWSSWTSWSRFEFLPHLTHLAVDVAYYSDGEDALISLRLRQILTSCYSLLVCLVLVPDDDAMINVSSALTRNRIDDLRLVILSDPDAVENWEASLRGATDVCQWAFAEGIVATKIRQSANDQEFDGLASRLNLVLRHCQ